MKEYTVRECLIEDDNNELAKCYVVTSKEDNKISVIAIPFKTKKEAKLWIDANKNINSN
jgi:hypothetical protein